MQKLKEVIIKAVSQSSNPMQLYKTLRQVDPDNKEYMLSWKSQVVRETKTIESLKEELEWFTVGLTPTIGKWPGNTRDVILMFTDGTKQAGWEFSGKRWEVYYSDGPGRCDCANPTKTVCAWRERIAGECLMELPDLIKSMDEQPHE